MEIPPCEPDSSLAPLEAATALFRKLDDAGIGYGAFKSTRTTPQGIAGLQDMDMLVRREDYGRFCEILSSVGAIRGVTHASLASLGREDWLVPDRATGAYLHLDAHVEVRLGGKFNKRYPFYDFDSIAQWVRLGTGDCMVPCASPQDEARVTLSRVAFRVRGLPWAPWVVLKGDWAREIDELLFASGGDAEREIRYEHAQPAVTCRVRKRGDDVQVHAGDLARIRAAARRAAGVSRITSLTDPVVNTARQWRYLGARVLNRFSPGISLDRRRPATGGLVVALVAPDGLGKSTQVARLRKLFGWKFSAATLYLGIGDGKGWWIRRKIVGAYVRRRDSIQKTMSEGGGAEAARSSARPSMKRRILGFAMAVWGLMAALERRSNVRRARRMANRGYIVICDRWPQDRRHGFLDGPLKPQDASLLPGVGWLARKEADLYRAMARQRPDVTLHLVADFAVSEARKPSGIDREGFEKRIALMEELRAADPRAEAVDGSADIDAVTADLAARIWRRL